jgi:hypothetical protein
MNNTIQFVVRMQDLMSGGLGKLASTSHSTFSKMANNSKQLTEKNKVLGMSFNELQKQIKDVENTISRSTIPSQIASARRELSALQSQSARHIGNTNGSTGSSSSGLGIGGVAVGSMLGGYAMQGISRIVGTATDLVGEMVTRSQDKEQAIVGLTTFLGKKEATLAYKDIRKDADLTPFDTTTLLGANRALISANIDRLTARKDVMNLGNAVSATSDGKNMPDVMARMALNLQQIKNNGVATGMDIRQFGFAGINLPELLKRSGQQSEGKITYEMIAKALAVANSKGGMYEGALAAQGQTEAGKASTAKDLFGNALSDLGDSFKPVRMQLLDMAIKFGNGMSSSLVTLQPYIDGFSNTLGKGLDFIMSMVNGTSEWNGWIDILKNNFNIVWQVVQHIGGKLWGFVSSIIDFVKHSQILKDLFSFIGLQMQFAGKIVMWIVDKIVWIWETLLKPILTFMDDVWKRITGRAITANVKHSIINPKKPKDVPENSPLGAGGSLAVSNQASGKTAGDTVAGASPRVVNIHVGKFFDNIQFTTMNGKETAQELENIVMECLARVVYNGSKMV